MGQLKYFLGIILLSCIFISSPYAQNKLSPDLARPPLYSRTVNPLDAMQYGRPTHKRPSSLADTGFSTLGVWTWGPCLGVEVTGNRTLVGQGQDYQVLDISDLSHPRLLYDTTLEEDVGYIKIIDTVLFVVEPNIVLFCDSRQLYPLKEYGRYVLQYDQLPPTLPPGPAFRQLTISDSLMFIIGFNIGILAVNISDLRNPVYRGVIGPGFFPTVDNSIAATGQYIFFGLQGPGVQLLIFPWQPDSVFDQQPKSYDVGGAAVSLNLRDSILFVGASGGRVSALDISDPWNPVTLDSLQLPSYAYQIVARGSNLYCFANNSEIYVLHIDNQMHLSLVGTVQQIGLHAFHTSASDSVIGLAETNGVEFYTIAQTDSIQRTTLFPSGGMYYGIAKRGNILYLASSYAGLWSVDFTDAQHPRAISNILTPSYAFDVVLTGNLACVLSGQDYSPLNDSVVIIQVSDSGSLNRLSAFLVNSNATITARDSLLIVVADSVDIFSIADPLHPSLLSTWYLPGGSPSVSVSGNILAVGAGVGDAGLYLLDITNPSSPIELSYTPQSPAGLLIEDTIVYLDAGYIIIYDISNPAIPRALGGVETACGCSASKIIRSGNYLYLTGEAVRVVDVTNLTNPVLVTSFLEGGFPYGFSASNDTLYVATSGEGVWALKNNIVTSVHEKPSSIPTAFALFDNYPNPFNPSTIIRYQLPVKSFVTLKVFSVLGQEVATLVSDNKPAGTYEVKWEADREPSGVYYYRLIAGRQTITKKMLLLK